jgi:hypothetical protein
MLATTPLRGILLGAAVLVTACKFPPPADVPDDDAMLDAATCIPSTVTCADGALTVCDDEGVATQRVCTFGCAPDGDRCGDLAPSNGLAAYLDQARAAPAIVWLGQAVIDTDAAQVLIDGRPVPTQTAIVASVPVEILVVVARSVEVDSVTAHGGRALAIVSDGDVLIHGTLSVSASHQLPGAGASRANDPACTARSGTASVGGTGGAGGGGFGTPGGAGGLGHLSPGGAGGGTLGNQKLVPLRGGCPGAFKVGAPSSNVAYEQPGAAGGALQISARGAVRLDPAAAITASGGGAKGDSQEPFSPICVEPTGTATSCNVGSGGGAGGAVLVESGDLVVPPTAVVVANGGAGSCGFVGFSPDGSLSEQPAQAPTCSSVSGAGAAGVGAAGDIAGGHGGDGDSAGGGGGGGVGRIRINLPAGVVFDPGPPIVSPSPTFGVALAR